MSTMTRPNTVPNPVANPVPNPRLVRYHAPTGLSTLFRPLPKQPGARPVLDVSYRPASGGPTLRFSAREALGIPEQTLLFVLLELAQEESQRSPESCHIGATSTEVTGRQLWSLLNPGAAGAEGETIHLQTSWFELNRRCNVSTGGSSQALRQAQLKRLCEVIVWEVEPDARRTTRQSYLVAWLVGDEERLHLALNVRLAGAILGGRYVSVSLAERLHLGADTTMALHAFLSTVLRPGHGFNVGLETLAERLWPGSSSSAPLGTQRRRRKVVRDSLNAIGGLQSWGVQWVSPNVAHVVRHAPKAARVRETTIPRLNASKPSSYREQPTPENAPYINAIEPFDVSGLFTTKP